VRRRLRVGAHLADATAVRLREVHRHAFSARARLKDDVVVVLLERGGSPAARLVHAAQQV